MTNRYNHSRVERAAQELWRESNLFAADLHPEREARYVLDMFSYPSGEGLHVGHPLSYIATDIISRHLRARGFAVLHPVGWDAFGLPAENYAIKVGVHPRETTARNIVRFTEQLNSLGFSYDWSREVNTSSSGYYRWTQWLFLKLYERGLAYRAEAPVNWCTGCQTVLANEQVQPDGTCERCQSKVEQRRLTQWFFKVTAYADELLAELDRLDWPEPVKAAQRHWIGRSEGYEVDFEIVPPVRGPVPSERSESREGTEGEGRVTVYTTRLDTIYGATYLVLAPEHPLVATLTSDEQRQEVERYVAQARQMTELARQEEGKKTGVFTGGYVINPATKERIPVWVADYVLGHYGTGAVMAVPTSDNRDDSFANEHELPRKPVVKPRSIDDIVVRPKLSDAGERVLVGGVLTSWGDESEADAFINYQKAVSSGKICFTGEGELINSAEFTGLSSAEARPKIAAKLSARPIVRYRLRDWLVSRQRYWGAPIPITYCAACGAVPVPEDQLPVLLPDDVDFRPTGEPPLARSKSFQRGVTCARCGGPARRETDTMDTFVCSSWYFLRYCDPANGQQPFSKKLIERWMPVDTYVGGAEHATGHLMFARFITKALADHPDVALPFREPFTRYRSQGLILGAIGDNMSKSRGNVVNPDEVIKTFGADSLRLYLMFMGPFEDAKPWSDEGILGARRFLDRVHRLFTALTEKSDKPRGTPSPSVHRAVRDVTSAIETFSFNTAVSSLMIFFNGTDWRSKLNEAGQWEGEGVDRAAAETFLKLLNPFAPHLAEHLWQALGHADSIQLAAWPTYDEALATGETATVAVQVNGKLRTTLTVPRGTEAAALEELARADVNVERYLADRRVAKVVTVPDRVINFVLEE